MADGHLNVCKECVKGAARRRWETDAYGIKERHRQTSRTGKDAATKKQYRLRFASTEEGRERLREYSRQWSARNREKRQAHSIVDNAIRSGKLIPQPCERCGSSEDINSHHEDYSKPLDVMWLCKKHHGERHQEINDARREVSF